MNEVRQFKITVPKLDDVSAADWKQYIEEAVGCWKGSFSPDNPLFELDSDDVKCVSFAKSKPPINRNAATEDLLRTALAQLERVLDSGALVLEAEGLAKYEDFQQLERDIRGFLGQPK